MASAKQNTLTRHRSLTESTAVLFPLPQIRHLWVECICAVMAIMITPVPAAGCFLNSSLWVTPQTILARSYRLVLLSVPPQCFLR